MGHIDSVVQKICTIEVKQFLVKKTSKIWIFALSNFKTRILYTVCAMKLKFSASNAGFLLNILPKNWPNRFSGSKDTRLWSWTTFSSKICNFSILRFELQDLYPMNASSSDVQIFRVEHKFPSQRAHEKWGKSAERFPRYTQLNSDHFFTDTLYYNFILKYIFDI